LHLLVNYPPQVSVSVLVNSLKGVSSRMIRQKRNSSMVKKLCALWSPSYFGGSCGGAPIAVIRQYIEKHSNHRKTQCQDGFAVRALDPALNAP
jgi:putative transposase